MNSDPSVDITLPDKDDLVDKINQKTLAQRIYDDLSALVQVINQYDEPIAFEYLLHRAQEYGYSIDPKSDNANQKHKSRLDKLARYEPSIYFHVVGRIPQSHIWVDMAIQHIGASEVNSENLNNVQRACVELGDDQSKKYFDATKRELQERALNEIDISDYNSAGELVDGIVRQVAANAVDILPQRQESRRQGSQSSAGHANEEIATRVLREYDLEEGERDSGCDFTTDTQNDSDLIIYDVDDVNWFIEIKSEGVRERVGRAVGNNDANWAIFGFFTDASEVRNGVLNGNQQTPAWPNTTDVAYVPAAVIEEVFTLDADTDDDQTAATRANSDGDLYLRANNVFAKDIHSLVTTGSLSDVSSGHHEEFL